MPYLVLYSPVQGRFWHTGVSSVDSYQGVQAAGAQGVYDSLREMGLHILEKKRVRGDYIAFYYSWMGGSREDGDRQMETEKMESEVHDDRTRHMKQNSEHGQFQEHRNMLFSW